MINSANNHDANILVFDSGVGGLSIVNHIRQQLPHSTITYLADNHYFPYGLLDEHTLIERACQLINAVTQQHNVDLVVIACNSASTLVLPALRHLLTVPVVGVVPAIKPAVLQSNNKVIGLLATPGTIQREYTDELIKDYAQHCDVIRVGSSKLVDIIEKTMHGKCFPIDVYQEILQPFFDHPRWAELDTIILACTHFPLAQRELSLAAPKIQYWIDSGEAIARRVKSLLTKKTPANNAATKTDLVLLTGQLNANNTIAHHFSQFGFTKIKQWPDTTQETDHKISQSH